LHDATAQVQSTVSQAIESNVPLVAKASSQLALVGLQTLGVPDAERVAISEKLSAEGYGLDALTWSHPSDQRPSWFAQRSTVFYYAAAAQPAAQQLASFMKAQTGQDFAVQLGAGLGVDPGRRQVTLFVHYVKA